MPLPRGGAAKPTKPAAKRPAIRPAPRTIPKPGDLASMVQAWRESPNPARRAAVEAYAAAHPKEDNGALARLALGVGSYEQKDYAAAIAALRKVQGKVPRLADYTAYYLAASRVEEKDTDGVIKDLDAAHPTEVRSPLARAGRGWCRRGRCNRATPRKASGCCESTTPNCRSRTAM